MKKHKGNKFQKIEKHKAWLKKHKQELQANTDKKTTKMIAKKSLGQNFLHDINVVENICKNVEIGNKIVLEVGPGTGFLTKGILKYKPKKLILIEKDVHLFRDLQKTFNREIYNGEIDIFNEDALNVDLRNLATIANKKITIVANLPYNIGTTLVMNWIQKYIDYIDNIVVMLQKEVVDRIVARPKICDYGRISVLIQAVCECEKLFDVRSECFFPKPKVVSSVVRIEPKSMQIDDRIMQNLDKICRLAFNQRRKKLSNAFKGSEFENILTNDVREKRAEELTVEDYINFASTV